MLELKPTSPAFAWDQMQIRLPDSIVTTIKNDTRKETTPETIRAIVECFENLLELHGITIPDDDRPDGNDAPLYGCTYGNLLDDITNILRGEN